MERKLILSPRPNCRICGKPMIEWNPFSYIHEHTECIADKVSDALMTIVKQSFKDTEKQILREQERQAMAYCETLALYHR